LSRIFEYPIGDIQIIRHNPIHITEEGMYVSCGMMKRMKINWTNIDEIIEEPKLLAEKRLKNTIEFIARDFEMNHPHIILKLKQPTEATLLFGKKEYKFVAIRVDEPNRFKKVVRGNLTK